MTKEESKDQNLLKKKIATLPIALQNRQNALCRKGCDYMALSLYIGPDP